MTNAKYYDASQQRLVFIGDLADADYWDGHWESNNFRQLLLAQRNRMVERITQRYLPPGAKVLEGGCGRGQNVLRLNELGYACVGIDYAATTVERINQALPELDVRLGDVRALPFADHSFDGYWSLGVIEHFYDGYQGIRDEMARVLKPGGYLFLTVPSLSFLRRLKSRLGLYPHWQASTEFKDRFYQFALHPLDVTTDFQQHGFKMISSTPIDGTKGLKDEIAFLRPPLQTLYDSKQLTGKLLRRILDVLTTPWSNHMHLFVFIRQ